MTIIMKAINPATNQLIKEYPEHTAAEAERILSAAGKAQKDWAQVAVGARVALIGKVAAHLRESINQYAVLNTQEMGKLLPDAKAEIEKCAFVCDYYAENAEEMLAAEPVAAEFTKSFVRFDPLGVILGVMPWNFPFWQVFRFAAPALAAGNAAVLKHASNVPGCALACEEIFKKSGLPENVFRTLLIGSSQVEAVIRHPVIKGVALTGNETAGSRVAAIAGELIKPTVLELGGSDPFIVLEDADLDRTVNGAFSSRLKNTGQSCNSAKRFIVHEKIIRDFTERLVAMVKNLVIGDPMDADTQIGPLARPDLVRELDRQVQESVRAGAKLVCGGRRFGDIGNFYAPTILTEVSETMPAWREETFGPVFAVTTTRDDDEAVRLANNSSYGLGASIWTKDIARAEKLAVQIEAGSVFVNAVVKSDPRLPFGGIKLSGYGRELSHYGIKEFVNIKTVMISSS